MWLRSVAVRLIPPEPSRDALFFSRHDRQAASAHALPLAASVPGDLHGERDQDEPYRELDLPVHRQPAEHAEDADHQQQRRDDQDVAGSAAGYGRRVCA